MDGGFLHLVLQAGDDVDFVDAWSTSGDKKVKRGYRIVGLYRKMEALHIL